MNYISAALRQQVIQRAEGRCEYCRLSQEGQEATFHIDHVMPVAHGGKTHLDNLALACVSCSLRKAARLEAVDPHTGQSVPLYNPRRQPWETLGERQRWHDTFSVRKNMEKLDIDLPKANII